MLLKGRIPPFWDNTGKSTPDLPNSCIHYGFSVLNTGLLSYFLCFSAQSPEKSHCMQRLDQFGLGYNKRKMKLIITMSIFFLHRKRCAFNLSAVFVHECNTSSQHNIDNADDILDRQPHELCAGIPIWNWISHENAKIYMYYYIIPESNI